MYKRQLLYIAVTTDTGGFQYANTNAATLRVAARLLELGADNRKISMDFFRKISRARMALVGQIYSGMRFFRGGQVAIAVVTRALIDSVHATEDDCDCLLYTSSWRCTSKCPAAQKKACIVRRGMV